jgi:hypothetical protein
MESLAPQARPTAQIKASKKGGSRKGKPPLTREFVVERATGLEPATLTLAR